MYTIDLDCAPGGIRPNDLLPGVLADTGVVIDPENTVSRFFGNWTWKVPSEYNVLYEKNRELIKNRIIALHEAGRIRYGSW